MKIQIYLEDLEIPEQYVDGIAAPEGNNVLSVVVYNPSIEKFSDVYRVRFEYYN